MAEVGSDGPEPGAGRRRWVLPAGVVAVVLAVVAGVLLPSSDEAASGVALGRGDLRTNVSAAAAPPEGLVPRWDRSLTEGSSGTITAPPGPLLGPDHVVVGETVVEIATGRVTGTVVTRATAMGRAVLRPVADTTVGVVGDGDVLVEVDVTTGTVLRRVPLDGAEGLDATGFATALPGGDLLVSGSDGRTARVSRDGTVRWLAEVGLSDPVVSERWVAGRLLGETGLVSGTVVVLDAASGMVTASLVADPDRPVADVPVLSEVPVLGDGAGSPVLVAGDVLVTAGPDAGPDTVDGAPMAWSLTDGRALPDRLPPLRDAAGEVLALPGEGAYAVREQVEGVGVVASRVPVTDTAAGAATVETGAPGLCPCDFAARVVADADGIVSVEAGAVVARGWDGAVGWRVPLPDEVGQSSTLILGDGRVVVADVGRGTAVVLSRAGGNRVGTVALSTVQPPIPGLSDRLVFAGEGIVGLRQRRGETDYLDVVSGGPAEPAAVVPGSGPWTRASQLMRRPNGTVVRYDEVESVPQLVGPEGTVELTLPDGIRGPQLRGATVAGPILGAMTFDRGDDGGSLAPQLAFGWDGELLWRTDTMRVPVSGAIDDRPFGLNPLFGLVVLDPEAGTPAWTSPDGDLTIAGPVTVADRDALVEVGSTVRARALDDGTELWTAVLPAWPTRAAPVVLSELVVVPLADGSVVGLDPADGAEMWRTEPLGAVTLTGAGAQVLVATRDAEVVRLDRAGAVVGTVPVAGVASELAVVGDNLLVVADDRLVAYGPPGGELPQDDIVELP